MQVTPPLLPGTPMLPLKTGQLGFCYKQHLHSNPDCSTFVNELAKQQAQNKTTQKSYKVLEGKGR